MNASKGKEVKKLRQERKDSILSCMEVHSTMALNCGQTTANPLQLSLFISANTIQITKPRHVLSGTP